MLTGRASWAVVATVQEPLDLVAAFAAHYLDLGAARVHLYLDGDQPDVAQALADRPGVAITCCDAASWHARRTGGRPGLITGRQRFNANAARRETCCDWLLHCDADEFLLPDGAVGAQLAGLEAQVAFAQIGMVERVWTRGEAPATIFDGVFFGPDRGHGQRRAGLDAALSACLNPQGLLGHAAGKSLVRRGAPVRMSIHFPEPSGAKLAPGALAAWRAAQGGVLAGRMAHFDGLTPLHWAVKTLRRHAEHAALQDGEGPLDLGPRTEDRKAQTRLVHALRREPVALRRAMEALLTAPRGSGIALPDLRGIAEAARRRFPDLALDFSVDAFDRRLRATHADLIAAMELAI